MIPGTQVVDRQGNLGTVVNPADYDWDYYPPGYTLVLFQDWPIPQWIKTTHLEPLAVNQNQEKPGKTKISKPVRRYEL